MWFLGWCSCLLKSAPAQGDNMPFWILPLFTVEWKVEKKTTLLPKHTGPWPKNDLGRGRRSQCGAHKKFPWLVQFSAITGALAQGIRKLIRITRSDISFNEWIIIIMTGLLGLQRFTTLNNSPLRSLTYFAGWWTHWTTFKEPTKYKGGGTRATAGRLVAQGQISFSLGD